MVADAGMLSAANLLALEQAGFRFIVGSKISKAPYDLADHLERHGNAFDDGQSIETTRTMGTGKDARARRVVYQWIVPTGDWGRRVGVVPLLWRRGRLRGTSAAFRAASWAFDC